MILESYHLAPVIETAPWVLSDGGALDIDRCPDCWERRAHIERYVFACKVFKHQRVLDFGCGVGFGLEMLARENTVIGVDSSAEAAAICLLRRGVSIWNSMPEEEWDGGVALEVIEHLEDPVSFIATIPARHLVASVPVQPTMARNHHHKHDFTIESFRALMETRFEIRSWWIQVMPFHSDPAVAIFHGEARAASERRRLAEKWKGTEFRTT